MALSRSFLSALGIEQDKINEIINAHAETVNGLKKELDEQKEANSKYATVEADYEALKAKTKDYDEIKSKLEKSEKDFEAYKHDVESKETVEKVKNAYRDLLIENKVGEKQIDAVLGVTDLESLELDEEGKLKNVDELNKAIQERWSGFITTTTTKGANPETPPKGGKVKLTRKEIMEIKDTAERQKAIKENAELFS